MKRYEDVRKNQKQFNKVAEEAINFFETMLIKFEEDFNIKEV